MKPLIIKIIVVVATAVAIAIMGFTSGVRYQKKQQKTIPVKIVTTVIKDTSTFRPKKPSGKVALKEKIKLVIPDYILDSIRVLNDSITKVRGNSIYLPKEQLLYRDSSYMAWISGIKPQLDSIKVFRKTIVNTVTNTVIPKEKTSRWEFGVQTGVVFVDKKLTPYTGIEASHKLMHWDFSVQAGYVYNGSKFSQYIVGRWSYNLIRF